MVCLCLCVFVGCAYSSYSAVAAVVVALNIRHAFCVIWFLIKYITVATGHSVCVYMDHHWKSIPMCSIWKMDAQWTRTCTSQLCIKHVYDVYGTQWLKWTSVYNSQCMLCTYKQWRLSISFDFVDCSLFVWRNRVQFRGANIKQFSMWSTNILSNNNKWFCCQFAIAWTRVQCMYVRTYARVHVVRTLGTDPNTMESHSVCFDCLASSWIQMIP